MSGSRLLAGVVLAAVCLARGSAVSAQQADDVAEAWIPKDQEVAMAERVRDYLNAARDELDLHALVGNADLDLLAYQHSREMAIRGVVSHHSHRFGVSTQTRVKLAFPRILQFAENVAVNRTVEDLHRALLASPGHRINRLDGSFTHVGIGVARGGPYQLYLTEVFVRATQPSMLEMAVLYTEAPADSLPRDEARGGQVISEVINVPRPDDTDPEYWTGKGIDAYIAGQYAEAVRAFRHALEIDPSYEFARFDLGRALLRNGEPAAALEVLSGYLETHEDDLDAWWSVGTASLTLGEYARAERAFRRVLADRARDAAAWYNLGLALEYQARLEDAERSYAQALHLDPGMQEAVAGLRRVRR